MSERDAVVDHPSLPLAPRLSIRWNWWWFRDFAAFLRGRGPRCTLRILLFMRVRIANAALLYIGPLEIQIRRPWLEGPARQHHPELFKDANR